MFIGSKTGSYIIKPEQTDNSSAKTFAKSGLSRQVLHCIMTIENSAKTFSAAVTNRCIGGMISAYNFLSAVENKLAGAVKTADNANSTPMTIHNAAIRQKNPLTAEDIVAVKEKIQATVNDFRTDKRGFEQLVEATMASAYSEASDAMTAYCQRIGQPVPKGYVHEIGMASMENGLKCADKHAGKNEEAKKSGKEVYEQDKLYIPNGAGIHPLVSVFKTELFSRNVKLSTDFDLIKEANDEIFATFDKLAEQGHSQSPQPFREQLAQINKSWEKLLVSTESDS
ncbi:MULTISPECIES: hypothetical protein [Enterobacterales]|uniref:Uncharacterized protein n=1 Tax=Candidatus Sodalis endolongispinus TaxID=2812662 RepID=A0ABS5YAK8_9GAMM|nr:MULTISPECIES: hypothetical protein [Enterobacterales]MBG6249435.1 hypothetical protein [Candidatus Symbiopectobacterium sp. PLON1]MBT9432050.1 hypothetical protein [Candidatus Sodalis endolongispinus]